MKKILIGLLTLFIFSAYMPVYSMSVSESVEEGLRDTRVQPEEPTDAPKWVEYVPEKYQNPRIDFSRGSAIAELTVGCILTDLIITCPIGIPMICHSTTKLKNIGWEDKKVKFFNGLEKAKTITNDSERQAYYNVLCKKCKMTEDKHQKRLREIAKQQNKV